MRTLMWLALASLVGCSSAGEPASRSPTAQASEDPVPAPNAPALEATEPADVAGDEGDGPVEEAQASECRTHYDCTVVRDACGRPYPAVANAAVEPPTAPDPCPPATYSVVEPGCLDGECTTERVWNDEHRRCDADAQCVITSVACDDWAAARRGHEAEVRRQRQGDVDEIGCPVGSQGDPRPRPNVACVNDICITRAPG